MVVAQDWSRKRNLRLRAAMADRQVSYQELAHATRCNVKTVQRWVYEGRQPRAAHAAAVARFLEIDANWLWPRKRSEVNPELINLYTHIAEVPMTVWTATAYEARQTIDVATSVSPALPHNLADIVQAKAAQGVQVRLCVSPAVAPTLRIEGAGTRVNSYRGLMGIFRFDNDMVVWLNRGGFGMDPSGPALHLRQSEQGGVFRYYLAIFSRLWDEGESIAQAGHDWFRTKNDLT